MACPACRGAQAVFLTCGFIKAAGDAGDTSLSPCHLSVSHLRHPTAAPELRWSHSKHRNGAFPISCAGCWGTPPCFQQAVNKEIRNPKNVAERETAVLRKIPKAFLLCIYLDLLPSQNGQQLNTQGGKGNLDYTQVCIEGSDLRPRCLNPTLLFASFAPPFPSSTLPYPCSCTRGLTAGWEALVFSSFGNISGQPSASSQQQELL